MMRVAGIRKYLSLYCFVVIILFCQITCESNNDDEELEIISGHGGTVTTKVEEDVLVLTRENFDLQVAKDIILVEFYAPWCGHCKSLAPEYAKAAAILKDEDPPILLAKVDATIESDLAKVFDVKGFPTLFVFRRGEKTEYDGPRTAMGIVEYMKQQADPNWKPPADVVLTLTSENFTDTVEEADLILVEFYAPWCGHCKNLAPGYERAAKVLKDLPKPIPLAKIDGTAEKEIADKYGATGWPTFGIFRKGVKYDYNGPREEAGIITYMKEQAKPPTHEVSSTKAVRNSFSKTEATIVGFFKSQIEPFYSQFVDAAYKLRDKFSFHHSFSEKIAEEFGIKQNRIVIYMPEVFATDYEPVKHVLSKEDAISTEIVGFIRKHCLPLVGERSHMSKFKYEDRYPLVVVYYDVDFSFEHRIQTQLIRKQVAKVASEYKGKITFAVSKEDDYESEMVNLGLDDSGEDVNVGFYESENVRYPMTPVEDFSSEELRQFVEDVLAKKIKPWIKSQPVPKNNTGPVYTIVGSTFEQLVTNTEKDVLLEFYAPWCGHCKKLEPIYKKLGKAFTYDDNILIAKIDSTANSVPPEFSVKGFPTLYYIPANDKKKPFIYEDERELSQLKDFVFRQLEKRSKKDEL